MAAALRRFFSETSMVIMGRARELTAHGRSDYFGEVSQDRRSRESVLASFPVALAKI